MSFIEDWRDGRMLRTTTAQVAAGVSVAAWLIAGTAVAYAEGFQLVPGGIPAAQEGTGPEANLPFLFAVYIITWAAFFGYVFYESRRRREMQGEIDALKRALEARDRETDDEGG